MKISPAPISTPISKEQPLDQTWMLWMKDVGNVLSKSTSTRQIKTEQNTINYNIQGNITHISYTGFGDFTSKLPNTVVLDSIIQTNDGGVIGHIVLSKGDRTITIPKLTKENGIVSGSYFNG